ncbi:hypothetical protein BGZ94_001026 [Podila epigama]|nr:hypothetical protein BGZ94_001026 [Podila epigama]
MSQTHSFSARQGFGQEFGQDRGQNVASQSQRANTHNQGAQGGGWGSFSSWINTAVSTVSGVIENPNVVVSKAHNIGQGIRNVASEQIDRVYESLDPEYEYERERQSQKQQHQPYPQRQDTSANQLDRQTPKQPVTNPSKMLERPSNDISDLLGPSPKEDRVLQKQTNSSSDNHTNPALAPGPSKLDYKEQSLDNQQGDGWGDDDGWGDGWNDEQIVLPPTAPSPPAPPPPAPPTIIESPPSSTNNNNNNNNKDEAKPHSTWPEVKEAPAKREVKDLFGGHDFSSSRKSNDSQRNTGALLVPSTETSSSNQSGSQRRTSADIRPADALFSTLDFASNAIGSAVLGVHQKVTSAHANGRRDSQSSIDRTRTPEPMASGPQKSWGREDAGVGQRDLSEKMDRLALLNPKLDVVGTGLGALESLGKKAAGAIADVRRAGGHQTQGYGYSDGSDGSLAFKVPRNMTYASLFEDAGGNGYITTLSNVAQDSSNRSRKLARDNQKILEMDQVFQVEELLSIPSLTNAVGGQAMDVLSGHKDFRVLVELLDQLGAPSTAHLRQLRNCTRKLGTLVQDTVNAFEQEWHNHQTRASEKDFFAKAPIKFFFESRLITIYTDSIRGLTQYTEKTCKQILKLAETFKLRTIKRAEGGDQGLDDHRPALDVAQVLLQLVGKLIVEAMFLVQTYDKTLDAVYKQARMFTTPLDSLDWDDMLFGTKKLSHLLLEQDTPAAIANIQSITLLVAEVLKHDLVLDAVQGRISPTWTPRPSQSKAQSQSESTMQSSWTTTTTTTTKTTQPQHRHNNTLSQARKPPMAPSNPAGPVTPPLSRSSTLQSSPIVSAATLQRQGTTSKLGSALPSAPTSASHSRPESPSVSSIQRPPSRARLGSGSGSSMGEAGTSATSPSPTMTKAAVSLEGSTFKGASLQPRPMRAKAPAPAPKPKLADEDFFSILNG